MSIRFRSVAAAALLAIATSACAWALSGKPTSAEMPFITAMQRDLASKYATPADAQKAGFFRYTNEDTTGAISYVNLHWTSTGADTPSQLWYDVHGRLLGADYSVLKSASPSAPTSWNGIAQARWEDFPEHIHYVLNNGGTMVYKATSLKKFVAAGGDPQNPQAATLVAMGLAKAPSDVVHIFDFPSIWDLTIWIVRNPDGAFADANPLVKPSTPASGSSM